MLNQLTDQERSAMAQRLRAARELARLSIRLVASELSVNVKSVVNWESGMVPSPDNRAALVQLYGVEDGILFSELAAREAAARKLLTA
jgi:transcriptional regulator with XRE-family HTH domain